MDRVHNSSNPNPMCALCMSEGEDHNHLFFDCSYSTEVWRGVSSKAQISWPGVPWSQGWEWAVMKFHSRNNQCSPNKGGRHQHAERQAFKFGKWRATGDGENSVGYPLGWFSGASPSSKARLNLGFFLGLLGGHGPLKPRVLGLNLWPSSSGPYRVGSLLEVSGLLCWALRWFSFGHGAIGKA
ncbi:hypothetical protein OIU84_029046 [Salix udensis]|uniref:Reverse transcriptase zinc-binding domain-containing protein n=1 Tax=Salix udensis TaxID=889485 RepID=A0AAD6KE47_9ROSI|nr:hypothetical protein OIU84_029046 [Salix udensis]